MNDREAFAAEVAQRVPAYAAFLASQGASANAQWERLPLTTKSAYLLAHPVAELCWDGSLASCHVIGASSGFGKSGSVFWPKRPVDEGAYLEGVEKMLVAYYGIDERRTLALICLAFGTWIGGMQVAAAMRGLASAAKHPFTVATPGLNLAEAVEIYARFGAGYDQVLWITNPSNVNLIAALLERRNCTPPPGSISFPVIGEYYTESFRERIARQFGHPLDAPFCVWTGYGSADTGDVGVETAATVVLRKFLHRNRDLSVELFGTEDAPMLLLPSAKAIIEIVDGNIVVTKDQLVPLVRYDTGDAGGLLPKQRLAELEAIPAELLEPLPDPVLFVRGRASDAIVFYGTNLGVSEINEFFFSLPADHRYGGLFEVRPVEDRGVTVFRFTVFVRGEAPEELADAYRHGLLGFLKGRSLEFNAKYEPLTRSVGRPLIEVVLRDIAETDGKLKHRYIVED